MTQPRRNPPVQRVRDRARKESSPAQQDKQGAGFRLLTETVASPTLAAQIRELLAGVSRRRSGCSGSRSAAHNAREGSRLAFGEYVDAQYAVEKADVILSLDADFLCTGAAGLRHARAFASRRRIEGDRAQTESSVRGRERRRPTPAPRPIIACR